MLVIFDVQQIFNKFNSAENDAKTIRKHQSYEEFTKVIFNHLRIHL